jgi:hypothetical protein
MSKMKDVISDICEMHTKGFKVITIAALLQQPVEVVEEVVENYQQEYDEVFYGSKVSCL